MKAKTIKKILRGKIDAWIKTIKDEKLRQDVRDNCIVTGGAIASMLLKEDVNDYDVYFTNKETTQKVAQYYVDLFKKNPPSTFKKRDKEVDILVVDDNDRIKILVQSQGVASAEGTSEYQYFEQLEPESSETEEFVEQTFKILNSRKPENENKPGKYEPLFLSSNAITLSDDIQLIVRFYGDADEIHKNYDFAHCTSYWESKTNKLVLRPEAMEALLARELVYVGSRYPLASIIRTRKFIQRGFSCNAGQYLKMAMQVSDLNLYDVHVLEDQLVGVDFAYFQALIEGIKKKVEKDGPANLSYDYIVNLVDNIF